MIKEESEIVNGIKIALIREIVSYDENKILEIVRKEIERNGYRRDSRPNA